MREASASEPPMTCRKPIRRCRNRGVPLPPGSARENPEACPSGIRHVGGGSSTRLLYGTNSLFRQVIKRFNLPFQRASSFKSPLFINTVKRFQHCINARETGALITSQLQKVLTTPDPTKCPLEEPSAGTPTPAAPSTPLPSSPAATTPAGPTTAPPATSPTAPTPLIPAPPDLGGR